MDNMFSNMSIILQVQIFNYRAVFEKLFPSRRFLCDWSYNLTQPSNFYPRFWRSVYKVKNYYYNKTAVSVCPPVLYFKNEYTFNYHFTFFQFSFRYLFRLLCDLTNKVMNNLRKPRVSQVAFATDSCCRTEVRWKMIFFYCSILC